MIVKCVECGMPGSFYIETKDKKEIRVADSLIRLTKQKHELALYIHKGCQDTL